MTWLIFGVIALGMALVAIGVRIMQTGASADERAGGSLPVILGIACIMIGLVVAFVYLLVKA